jgi:hypothetical protein
MERSPASLNNGPSGALPNLHTNNGPPGALDGLQQHQPLLNSPPSTNHVVNPNGCPPTVVHDTKVVHSDNCYPPSSSSSTTTTSTLVHAPPPPNNMPTDTRVIHTNNCATVVHPNGANTNVMQSNNCPNSGSTSSSTSSPSLSSSHLTINNVQGSNSEVSTSSSTSNTNTIPISNAGPNQKVHPSDRVTLDGSKSSDPSGGSLKFSWLQLAGGPVISLSNHDKAKTTFVAPSIIGTTLLTFQLIVNNGNAYSAPSYVTVTVQP